MLSARFRAESFCANYLAALLIDWSSLFCLAQNTAMFCLPLPHGPTSQPTDGQTHLYQYIGAKPTVLGSQTGGCIVRRFHRLFLVLFPLLIACAAFGEDPSSPGTTKYPPVNPVVSWTLRIA